MRGGGALCAESEAWGRLEKSFGRVYVPHPADEEILSELNEKASDPDLGFVLIVVGMPGVGKTLLLKDLIEGLSYHHFSDKCKSMINNITNAFEFRDVAEILPFDERKRKGDYPTKKRVVWVTTALDDFVDTSVEAQESLQALHRKMEHGLGKGESLIVFGNRGILGDVADKDAPVIRTLCHIVRGRARRRFKFVRIPKEYDVFWIKQFGIDEPLFNLTGGLEGFKQYSKALIRLSENFIRKCSKRGKADPKCQHCCAGIFLRYVSELNEMLEDRNFIARVHDLLFFLWLRHCDLYLTPRCLNLFWGYCLFNLWKLVEEEHDPNRKAIDKSLIYDAVYSSRLPSIRGPEEYQLTEANIQKYRDEEFESGVLSRYERSCLNAKMRRRERLKLYFSPKNMHYKEMIDDGALDEYLDLERLRSKMGQILLKLVLMRPIPMKGGKLSEIITQNWSQIKLLFGTITELVEKKSKSHKARRLLVVMFDDRLFRDVTFRGFRITPDEIRYLEMRERILELDAKVRENPPERTPRFNLELRDYEILRDLTSKIREPDLISTPSLRRKVLAFVRSLNGMTDYLVAPLTHDYLKERSKRNDETGLWLYSLKHGRDCNVRIEQGEMRIGIDGETYAINIGDPPKLSRLTITFGVGLRKRKDFGTYPALEDLEATVGGERHGLAYRFRDYGKLSLAIRRRLEDCGTISKAPKILEKVRIFYQLSDLVGPSLRTGGSFTRWMIDGECPQVGILDVRREKRRRKKVFLGRKGVLFLEAASKSSELVRSFEDLVVLEVLAEKIKNISLVLGALRRQGSIDCLCGKAKGKEIHQLEGRTIQINSKEIFTTLHEAYLVHCESPEIIPLAVSTCSPMVISSLIYNEIYQFHHALRMLLQIWINESSKGSWSLVMADPYELSDRMGREITRGFEKIELLRTSRARARYISIPDRLLSDLVAYFGAVHATHATLRGMETPKQLPFSDFIKLIKKEFRILIDPDDAIKFIEDSVDYQSLGIDSKVARGYLISEYHRFTERLETLGLATIRPDGDVMIRVE